MLSHISFGTTDLDVSIAFYDAVLSAIGIGRLWTVEDGAGYGEAGAEDRFAIKLNPGATAAGAGFHCAFEAPTRHSVDAFHHAGVASGGIDNGAPGLRPHYGQNYYAAFLIDPHGNAIEAVCDLPPAKVTNDGPH